MKKLVLRSATAFGLLALAAVLVLQVFGDDMLESRLYIPEAKQPEGFPEPGKVGEIVVKTYPAHRAAVVQRADAGQDQMFRMLFNHIQKNDIKMTAPVEMTFDNKGESSMAFLYQKPDIGQLGQDGLVKVVDVPPETVVSIAVRGEYTKASWEQNTTELNDWLAKNKQWEAIGPSRYLGFNSPFVPKMLRYGEVQISIRAKNE